MLFRMALLRTVFKRWAGNRNNEMASYWSRLLSPTTYLPNDRLRRHSSQLRRVPALQHSAGVARRVLPLARLSVRFTLSLSLYQPFHSCASSRPVCIRSRPSRFEQQERMTPSPDLFILLPLRSNLGFLRIEDNIWVYHYD